eukprot:scaffold2782_cov182-Amphora_coffeaeformis.AAC.26
MGPFIRRTEDQLEKIPAFADGCVAVGSAWLAAVAVAPFIMSVDRAVVSYTATGGSLTRGISKAAVEFLRQPRQALASPALWMVAGVYGLTYTSANISDVVTERTPNVSPSSAAAGKFVATTAVNMGSSIAKDAAFARMFTVGVVGGTVAASAALTVPLGSYALFAARDCFTIGGAFFVPDILADSLRKANIMSSDQQATMSAQLLTPPLMQVVCTPLHVLALQLVQVPMASLSHRMTALSQAAPVMFVARASV